MEGIYVLLVSISKNMAVDIGALRRVAFKKGVYAYVGSAQNSLEKRLQRHFRKAKRRFWHIDYLLTNAHARVIEAFYKEAEKPEECNVARKMGATGFAVKNFGCSDCNCESHLFWFSCRRSLEDLCLALGFRLFYLANESLYWETSEA
ncbi:MAG: GIY-YIG nuclease family protein [Nitrososphaerota archaeon]|nr:GIY-YIG nuclease family protein [Nitrososphaerota archaeon]